MQSETFGGFTPVLPGIDIRFEKPGMADHFERAWRTAGPPALDVSGGLSIADQITIGTTFEHELRHFHDYLICHDALEISWLKRQIFTAAMPAVVDALSSDAHQVIPFPILTWAGMTEAQRNTVVAENADLLRAGDAVWRPLRLRSNPKVPAANITVLPDNAPRGTIEIGFRAVLEDVRRKTERMDKLRLGLDEPVEGERRFTSTFVYELSALNAQAAAVYTTYGIKEFTQFIGKLINDGTAYSRFFLTMLSVFAIQGRPNVAFDPSDIDFPRLNTAIFWSLLGTRDDGNLSSPAVRISTLLHAAERGWSHVFPQTSVPSNLLDHWDTMAGVTPWRRSLEATQARLEGETNGILHSYAKAVDSVGAPLPPALKIFRAVLDRRRLLIDKLKVDPDRYIDPQTWANDLQHWPQCPVHLKFSPSRTRRRRADYSAWGDRAIFNLTTTFSFEDKSHPTTEEIGDLVGDVYLPCYLPPDMEFPLQPIVGTQQMMMLFDLLFEPSQVNGRDERALRGFVRTEFGKRLLRLF